MAVFKRAIREFSEQIDVLRQRVELLVPVVKREFRFLNIALIILEEMNEELAKRRIHMHYGKEELEEDLGV